MDTVLGNEPTVCFSVFGDDVLVAEGIVAAGARLRFAATAPEQADALLAVTMDLTDEMATNLAYAAGSRRRPAVLVVTETVLGQPLDAELASGPVRLVPRRNATTRGIAALLHAVAADRGEPAAAHLERLLSDLRRRCVRPRGLDERETRLLNLLADGADTTAIARDLHCSNYTVKRLVRDLLQRYHARNRAHIVAHALQANLI
ncbi:helix-turn-helix transcriptional regulator [Kutzneria kofuensis]|uniref:DNA-binding NarL/FixJ family response regulator n=1 Tax=Kutzneria kofuensis TaxID=103725 RepID=A0A7W9NEC9_9PSEU|nr:LuxR C-terminal-related transcriptional regulator [Kutzneria kofuensis]MBB5888818.1 DNA-binding NarL/FixJ family response regulator [Kutzneria kofuensis]